MDAPTITVTHTGGECVVTLTGDIDVAVEHNIGNAITRAVGDCPPQVTVVTVDLSGVTFLDSTGLGALLDAHQSVAAQEREMVLRGTPPRLARLFDLTGLSDVFTFQ